MKPLFALALLGLLLAAFVIALRRGGGRGRAAFTARKVLTEAEQVLYWRLRRALPEQVVLAQVAMSALLSAPRSKAGHSARLTISQKYVDFVICHPDASVLAVIELDDASHQRSSQRKRDQVKDAALASAGLRVIRWQARALPDELAIRTEVLGNPAVLSPQVLRA